MVSTMIFNMLDEKIQKMRELRHLETVKNNKAQQDITDFRYVSLIHEIHHCIEVLYYSYHEFNFILTEAIKTDLYEVLLKLQNAVITGFAEREIITETEISFKNIQNSIKKDWNKHYYLITSTTVSTLNILSGISVEKVIGCTNDIKAAEMWTGEKKALYNLKKALDEAEILIKSLSLDQEIIIFLTNMNAGRTYISDLNEKVLSWIRKESLESKIKLSFISK